MVLVGSSSVSDVIAWTTASDPARVDNAYWLEAARLLERVGVVLG